MNKGLKVLFAAVVMLLVASSVAANHYCMPTDSRKINSKFGHRWGRLHKGMDIKVQIGDTIRAAFDGKITVSKYNKGGYGHYIVVSHKDGMETLYGHLSKRLANIGTKVKAGDPIGLGGNTGHSTGSHLHFEVRQHGKVTDPEDMFDFAHQCLKGIETEENPQEEIELSPLHEDTQLALTHTGTSELPTWLAIQSDKFDMPAILSSHEDETEASSYASLTVIFLKLAKKTGKHKRFTNPVSNPERPIKAIGALAIHRTSMSEPPPVVVEIIQPPPQPPQYSG